MITPLLKILAKNERFYAGLSYLESREIQPGELPDIVDFSRQFQQFLALNGKEVSKADLPALRLVQQSADSGNSWSIFTDWVARHYGTPSQGVLTCAYQFEGEHTRHFLLERYRQIKSIKDVMALLAVSQITNISVDILRDKSIEILSGGKPGFYALRIMATWASMMHFDDEHLKQMIIDRILASELNKSGFTCAAYSLECLNASKQERYQLVRTAINSPAIQDLDDQVADIFHVYVLRYLTSGQLEELRVIAEDSRKYRPSSFVHSLLLSIEAWQYIDSNCITEVPQESFSTYLCDLCAEIFPSVSLEDQSRFDNSYRTPYIETLRMVANGEENIDDSAAMALRDALLRETSRLTAE